MDSGSEIEKSYRLLVAIRTKFSGNLRGGWTGDFDSRCKPQALMAILEKVGILLEGRTTVTCVDYLSVLQQYGQRDDVLIYADPPYVAKGAQLYRCSFNLKNHIRLANAVKNTTASIFISYDNHAIVRLLYKDLNNAIPFGFTTPYSVSSHGHRPIKTEILIRRGNYANLRSSKELGASIFDSYARMIQPWNKRYVKIIETLRQVAAEYRTEGRRSA
jgi:site-specific DNA-adenine methylase